MNKGKNKILAILLIAAFCFSSLGMTMADGSTPEPTPSVMQADEVSPTPTGEATPTPTDEATPTPTGEPTPTPAGEPTPTPTAPALPGSIGGTVWVDANEDGVKDSDESLLACFTVSLYKEGDLSNAVATAKTGEDSAYEFTDIAPGRYVLGIQAQEIDEVEYLLPLVGYTNDNKFKIADDWINAYTKAIAVEADSAITNLHSGVRTPPAMQLLMLPPNTAGESESNPATDETELRAAIDAAAAGDTIYVKGDFAFTAAITIGKNLTIIGVNNPVLTVNDNYRHFTSTTPGITLKLQNMTLTGRGTNLGGGVYVYGNVTLTNCTITGNTTAMMGGGVMASNTATLTNCTITGNTTYDRGGGVYASTATLTNCTVTGNKAITTTSSGGGVYASIATLTNCTITGNTADGSGGGVYTPGIANLTNCTITGNTAGSGGGGVLANATANIYGSIVAGNTAGGSESNIRGGGMNWANTGLTNDGNYNIIGYSGVATEAAVFGSGGPQLASNGGPTQTIALATGSPAIGAIPVGPAAGAVTWAAPKKDQRGYVRGAGYICIGAYEAEGTELVVKNTNNDCIASLRWCIDNSEAGDTITFDPTVFTGGQVIMLGSQLDVTQNLTIQGPTAGVEIKVNDYYRHFYSTTPNITLKLQNMTLTGRGTNPGGGVYVNNGTLNMESCTVRDCYNTDRGGGVYASTATLTNCTVTGNKAITATGSGGGVYASTATLTNCTITGNTADGSGGGVYATTATLTNCTVTGNTAGYDGGGVYTLDTVNIYGNIVAGNTMGGNENNIRVGGSMWGDETPTAPNYNIIGQPSGHTLADIFGTANPALGGDGTILIDPTGPAHNAIPAGTSWLPTTDQRGISRPQGAGGDIGAVELECYALTLTANTGGSITQGTNGEYAAGEAVSISATANNGYTFTGWVATGGGTFADATGAVTTYTMPGNAAAITANFETSIAPPVPVTGVTLDKNTLALTVNDTQTLIAAVVPANATNPSVTWASDTPSVATVDNSGVVTAKAVGTAKITVTTADGGYTAVCGVTVQENIYDFTTAFGTYTGQAGGLTGIIDADAAKFERLEVNGQTLHGSNYSTNAGSTIITLHPSYLDTLDNGTYTVRAVFTDGYADGSFIVNVQDNVVSVTGIKLDKTKLTLAVGKNATLTATVSPSNATDKGMTWSSSNTAIATVDNSGKVTGVKAGTATITVTTDDGGYTATCEVTVKDTVGLPQTGDNGNRMLWIVIMLTSVLGILCVLVWRKRRRLR